jgi:hypothetical protein
MDICIRVPETGEWTSSPTRVLPAMRDAYASYKARPHTVQELPYIAGQYIVYRPDNDPYLPTYIARMADIDPGAIGDGPNAGNGTAAHMTVSGEMHDRLPSRTPIIDMLDVMAFIVDPPAGSRPTWLPCRDYQAWAFRDFIYDPRRSTKKSYMSPYTSYLAFTGATLANQIVTIDLPDLAPNIVFNVSRNDNNSVFFERNDARGSRVRMCDNANARIGYMAYYTRLTMDIGIVVLSPRSHGQLTAAASSALLSTGHLPPPEETNCEDEQCILCNHNKVNARFSPCEHAACCSTCYSKFTKNECPLCRSNILRLLQQ